ncbi:MAG TPA: hypothetical protein ENG92_02080, partial [Thiolapillus brandeum]|nr:hypothetical protein [Thiolapillus brandeum]
MNNKYSAYIISALVLGGVIGYILATTAPEDQQSDVNNGCDGQQILQKGKAYLAQGNVSKSGLYFSRAITCNPGNWALLDEYRNTIIGHAKKLSSKGHVEEASGLLVDLETFLRSQAQYLDSAVLEKLYIAIENVSKTRQQMVGTDGQSSSFSEVRRYFDRLMAELRPQQESSQGAADEQLLMYKLATAENLLQKMLLLSDTSDNADWKTATRRSMDKFRNVKQAISKSRSRWVLDSLEGEFSRLASFKGDNKLSNSASCPKKKPGTLQKSIDVRKKFSQRILEKVQKITDPDTRKKAMKMLEENQSKISDAHVQQLKKYQLWAIVVMENALKDYRKAKGRINDNEGLIKQILQSHMAKIDTRLLDFNARAGYNELFSMAYGELDGDDKIP